MSQHETTPQKMQVGFLRSCIDKRFVEVTRAYVEQVIGLEADAYYHEAVAGGALGFPPPLNGADYVYHQAFVKEKFDLVCMVWQVHYDDCGGLPPEQNDPRYNNNKIFADFFDVFLSKDPLISFQLRYPLVQRHIFLIARLDDHGEPFVEVAPFD
ncbi:MAG TPA: hypothetical protein VKR42_09760 [Ktedonobacteraceae bacterium]|nr:hypothetical protein [Ktedonobacteraceae bacterium]